MLEAEPNVRPKTVRAPFFEALAVSAFLHLICIVLIEPARWSGPDETVIETHLAPAPMMTPIVAIQKSLPREQPPVQTQPETRTQPADSHTTAKESARSDLNDLPAAVGKHAKPKHPDMVMRDEASSVALPEVPLLIDTHWYTAREVERRPEPVDEIEFIYPDEARRRGITGSVVLVVHIDMTGEVREVKILESNPPEVFDAAVIAAYRQARFTPALRGGRPVRYVGTFEVSFALE